MKQLLRNFKCSKCNTLSKINVYPQINVDQHPKWKDKVRDYSLFRHYCPRCGHISNLVYPCFYQNASSQFLILLFPNGGSPDDFLSKEIMQLSSSYRKRYCYTLEEFIEKVSVFEDGLEDRSIELLKLLLFASIHKKNQSLQSLYYYRKSENNNLEFTLLFEGGNAEGVQILYEKYEEIRSLVEEEQEPLDNKFYEINPEWAGQQILS